MTLTDWCVAGRLLDNTVITIDGNPVALTFPNAGAYLVHPTAALSMLARLVASMTLAGVAAPAAFVTEAGFVRLTSSGVFSISWGEATEFRDLLGFTGNLAAASSYLPHTQWFLHRQFHP